MLQRKRLNQAFKKKYKDKIIHQSADCYGQVQVIDEEMIRSLHFDAVEKQSAMSLESPEKLVLSYTEFMMAGFLFHRKISRVLCIGLGGGSIPRFLGHFFKNCQIDVVEIREHVINIAKDYFLLPNDSRFRYIEADGATFIKQQANEFYDMILVDAFDHKGVAEEVTESSFIESCSNSLSANGIFCANLWSHPHYVFRTTIGGILTQFGDQVMDIPVKERTNRIVLAIKPPWQKPTLQTLKKRSKLLEESLKLPFKNITKILLRNNKELFK